MKSLQYNQNQSNERVILKPETLKMKTQTHLHITIHQLLTAKGHHANCQL